MADAVSLQGVEAFQVQQRRRIFIDRRVTRAHRLDITGGRGDHFRVSGVSLFHHLTNRNRGHDRGRQLIGEHIAQRAAEVFVLE